MKMTRGTLSVQNEGWGFFLFSSFVSFFRILWPFFSTSPPQLFSKPCVSEKMRSSSHFNAAALNPYSFCLRWKKKIKRKWSDCFICAYKAYLWPFKFAGIHAFYKYIHIFIYKSIWDCVTLLNNAFFSPLCVCVCLCGEGIKWLLTWAPSQ